jgi:Carboxypeptidase regulatory-like domain
MRKATLFMLSAVLLLACDLAGQDAPRSSPAQPSQPNQQETSSSSSSHPNKRKPLPGFLIIGSIFNEKALSFPGVEVRVRRNDEKKFRWTTTTNSRGEFAVRVPEGMEYEVVVRVKKYRDVSRVVNTNNGDVQQRLSIRLEPADSGDKGATQ